MPIPGSPELSHDNGTGSAELSYQNETGTAEVSHDNRTTVVLMFSYTSDE